MAATPEEFPGQGDPEPEPFSPSVFFDLPPTPSEEDPAASTDDLALSFISRILMEEDIDEKFLYHYPDHPALLQTQQPFAQILSGPSAASDSFATNNDGSAACTLPPSSDVPAFANNATWPYDPAEFSQLLLSTPCPDMGAGIDGFTADDPNQFLLPQQDTASARFHQSVDEANAFRNCGGAGIQCSELLAGPEETTTSTTSSPTGDREHGALASTFFSGQNRVNMDMLNQAFLRGMEEAKKFLPIDSSLLVEARGCKLPQVFVPGHAMNEDRVDRMLTFQGISNGRGRKNRCNWQDLENAEMSRNSKLMVLELEETDEIIDEIILNEYRLCLNGMLGLDITMDSVDGKFVRKGNWKSALRRQSLNEEWTSTHCLFTVHRPFRWTIVGVRPCYLSRSSSIPHRGEMPVKVAKLPWHFVYLGRGPPEVRITGIDLPLPGFRPAAHIEEIGRRLSKCARQFGIPFKFQSIAAKWEMVSVDDLHIDPDEALIINGLFDFGNLMDEGVDIYSPSPRDMVLGTKIQTRFAAVQYLHHDNDRRLLIEWGLFGRFALNVIACEGSDRVERHETYKQWQVRNHRAGLRQLPLDPDIVKVVRNKVKESYHKDFVIDVDHQWLLEGWKGRIICAMSTWVTDDAFSEH
ncbi:unnamed protein product [Miscanthus lutarioriparius]|uniref:Uncharacterized protein n=1 Tax=Miscanthus lutarioriparius TaxID=422564 RepID=A0A811NGN6_9POAL|nr:unnamed protein product [Miscanthus lutarioriparius]